MVEPLPNEAEVVRESARGDGEAFGELVNHYQNAIFNLVVRMLGNREDARDVTQEVFLKAYRRLRSFKGRSRFATWLCSIAVNQSISERRKQSAASRRGGVPMSVLEGDDGRSYDPPGDTAGPDESLQAEETMQQIEAAIDELSDDYRSVVVLRDIEGLDYRAISEALGCSRGTIKSRLHRARLQLRRTLQGLVAT
ncbi:MAG: RNA polymerase sigma factor [Planctomycetota bacterium]